MKSTSPIALLFFLCALPLLHQAQVATYTAGNPVGSGPAAVTLSNFSLGPGIIPPTSPCFGSWFQAKGYSTTSGANSTAFTRGNYWTFTVTPQSGTQVTYTDINATGVRIASSGPSGHEWSYQIGSNPIVYRNSVTITPVSNCGSAGTAIGWNFDDFTTGEPVTFRFLSWGASNINANIRIGNIVLGGIAALPVELVHFEAKPEPSGILLQWQTASETDNEYFEIEHAHDGINFEPIARIAGAGTTLTSRSYAFLHRTPALGANYYRLKQVDFDGTQSFSPIEAETFGSKSDLRVFPTLVQDFIHIQRFPDAADEPVMVEIFDLNGQVVLSVWTAALLDEKFLIDYFPPGLYVVRVSTRQSIDSARFLKL